MARPTTTPTTTRTRSSRRAGTTPAGVAEHPLLLDLLELPDPPAGPPVPGTEGHRTRMRARLLTAGPEALNDQDLLEMLLFIALPRRDTKAIARALLARFDTFAAAITAPLTELLAVEGLGESGAAALKTAQAAALRLVRGKVLGRTVIGNWQALLDYLSALLAHERVECFRVLFLDARNRLLADEAQGQGTINRAPVFPREVARRALELHATAVILVHNHPSGDPSPSKDDVAMTRAIAQALEPLGITLHDHVVVGGAATTSFRQQGLL
jgi:DNA repair protein RadC